mmetsp:Transcript_33013/g.82216  ORF Transcript_33013/g.82216 Transcript_33013/m.82216 type:complete len:212 (+) Transcript_33013:1538-2173(+)
MVASRADCSVPNSRAFFPLRSSPSSCSRVANSAAVAAAPPGSACAASSCLRTSLSCPIWMRHLAARRCAFRSVGSSSSAAFASDSAAALLFSASSAADRFIRYVGLSGASSIAWPYSSTALAYSPALYLPLPASLHAAARSAADGAAAAAGSASIGSLASSPSLSSSSSSSPPPPSSSFFTSSSARRSSSRICALFGSSCSPFFAAVMASR